MKTPFLAASMLAATSFSHAGFTPIDDTQLGDVTGQAGVTIEPTIRAEIGSIVYTDEGSIGINNIVFGGANKSSYFGISNLGDGVHSGNALDGAKLRVDVRENGDVKIVGGPKGGIFGGFIDFSLSTGRIDLISDDGLTTTTLVDSINMTGLFSGFTARINADTLHTQIGLSMGIDDIDIDISSLGLKVEDAFITSSNYFEELEFQDEFPRDVRLPHLTADFDFDLYADEEGLHVDVLTIEFDMGIGAIMVADASIGSFRLDNVNLNGLSMVISGHP